MKQMLNSRIQGTTLLEVLVAVALVGVIAYFIMFAANSLNENATLAVSRGRASGALDRLEAFLELRTAELFASGADACNTFDTEMASAFSAEVIDGENLTFELSSAANLASPPAILVGASPDYLAAWDSCVISLPTSITDGTINFCVTLNLADSTQPARHVGTIAPSFAKVTAQLVNAHNNLPVNCLNFNRTITPARLVKFNYTMYWLGQSGSGYMVLSRQARFFGSLDREG